MGNLLQWFFYCNYIADTGGTNVQFDSKFVERRIFSVPQHFDLHVIASFRICCLRDVLFVIKLKTMVLS